MKTIIEPFKIKVVEPLKLTTQAPFLRHFTARLAAQLAELTGETMTKAVTVAIWERIARVQRQRNAPGILACAQEIIRQSGGAEPYKNTTLTAESWLYRPAYAAGTHQSHS